MTLIFADGFETGDISKWGYGWETTQSVIKHSGNFAIKSNYGGAYGGCLNEFGFKFTF
jgi:hypothetical protein